MDFRLLSDIFRWWYPLKVVTMVRAPAECTPGKDAHCATSISVVPSGVYCRIHTAPPTSNNGPLPQHNYGIKTAPSFPRHKTSYKCKGTRKPDGISYDRYLNEQYVKRVFFQGKLRVLLIPPPCDAYKSVILKLTENVVITYFKLRGHQFIHGIAFKN